MSAERNEAIKRLESDKVSIEGVVRLFQHEKIEGVPCICCGGEPHIFGIDIKIEPTASVYPGLKMKSVDDFIDEWLTVNKLEIRGKRVRVTVEVIEETPEVTPSE